MRAEASGISLTDQDASIVKGMLARGDRQHDIAAWFGVNGGRVADISTGKTFSQVPIQHANLPPPGPYSSGRDVMAARKELEGVRDRLKEVLEHVEDQIAKLE